jgi:hypothetical protein
MTESDTAALIKWSVIGVGIYLAYQAIKGTANIAVNAASAAGSSVADAAQFLLGNGIAQPGETYDVTMPDGSVQTLAYGSLIGSGLPAVGTGTQIGTGNSIADSLGAGESAGG